MLIDINSKVGQWPFKKLKFQTCRELVDRMDQYGVDVSVVSSLNGIFYKNTQSANQDLFNEWNASDILKDRLIPFGVINPTYAGWKYDLNQCMEQWGMKGICVYPKYHDYSINDPKLIEMVEMARDYDLVVALTLRMVDFRQRSWLGIEREWALRDVLPLIRAVPDAKYFVYNVANSTKLDDPDRHVWNNAAVLMDTSGRTLNNLSVHLDDFGSDKFGFGSHAPILDYCTGRLRIEFLDQNIEEAVKEKLRYENASKMLKIV